MWICLEGDWYQATNNAHKQSTASTPSARQFNVTEAQHSFQQDSEKVFTITTLTLTKCIRAAHSPFWGTLSTHELRVVMLTLTVTSALSTSARTRLLRHGSRTRRKGKEGRVKVATVMTTATAIDTGMRNRPGWRQPRQFYYAEEALTFLLMKKR